MSRTRMSRAIEAVVFWSALPFWLALSLITVTIEECGRIRRMWREFR